jgi:serine protease Do
MKLMQLFCIAIVIAGLAVLALVVPSHVYGQPRPLGPDRMLLRGPGSEIGVSVRDIEAGDGERQKVDGGAVIQEVRPGSPASAAGLQAADVVVEFDGERVRSARQFSRLVQETPPGRAVRATVVREGRRIEVSITPAAGTGFIDSERLREQVDEFVAGIPFNLESALPGMSPRGRLGVTLQELTPELASYFGAKDGVLVASVSSGSPAAQAGLRAGDVITSVNGATVGSRSDVLRALRDVTEGEVTIGIVREKKESTVKATLAAEPRGPTRRTRPV